MGCSSVDVEEISRRNILSLTNYRNMDSYVQNKSLEEIDKDIKQCQSILNKLNRMSSSDHNEQIKIIKSKTYMDVKLNLLKQMRESKLYLIESQQIAKAYDIKINQLLNYKIYVQKIILNLIRERTK